MIPAASRKRLPQRQARAAAASRTARLAPGMCLEPSPDTWSGETGEEMGATGGVAGPGRRGAPGRDGEEGSHGTDDRAAVIAAATPPNTLEGSELIGGATKVGRI